MKDTNTLSNSKLRGQPFIGTTITYNNPKDPGFKEEIERRCIFCFYRSDQGGVIGDCNISKGLAKRDFNINLENFLPSTLDGKEVGNYCKHFVDFRDD